MAITHRDRLYQLRAELNLKGCPSELLPVTRRILAVAQKAGRKDEIAHAHNYLSVVLLRLGLHQAAEAEARAALRVYAGVSSQSSEVIGCYQCVLARTLAAQGRFSEALEATAEGCRQYAVIYHSPDDFLAARLGELAELQQGKEPAPLEW